MQRSVVPVLMSGGSGTRLWPLSRKRNPKQFLRLDGGATLFQTTVKRMSGKSGTVNFSAPVVISGVSHGLLVRSQLDEADVKACDILLEPEGRDTAAAIAAACAFLVSEGRGNEVMLVSPCDHAVRNVEAFHRSVAEAAALAEQGRLVIFGIEPDHPATGYGYISFGAPDGVAGRPVEAFREKPKRGLAEQLLATGTALWNAGIFMFTAKAGLAAIDETAPDIAKAARQAVETATKSDVGLTLDPDAFAASPKLPFDIAVMEKVSGARVIPSDWGWSDVGSWRAVHEESHRDASNNSIQGDAIVEESENLLVRSEAMTVTALGVKDLVIVATADAVLVAPQHRSEDLKQIVQRLKDENRGDLL